MNERIALIEKRERCLARQRALVHEIRALDARLAAPPVRGETPAPKQSVPTGAALFAFGVFGVAGVAYLFFRA